MAEAISSDLVERLDPRPGDQGGAGLVEGDVAVGTDAADEELHAARRLDLLLVLGALLLQVGGVAVQQVGVLWLRAFIMLYTHGTGFVKCFLVLMPC